MISIQDVSVKFQTKDTCVQAVDCVNLSIQQGDIFGIIGYSGAGKSTLLRCLNLLERPTTGHIYIDNQDLLAMNKKELRRIRSNIGMIFQQFNLISTKTVAENILFNLKAGTIPSNEHQERVEELLHLVGLSDKANNYPSELSGGQKQRVGIARALANNPSILLCDEATSALDLETTKQILSLLRDINQKLGITIVLVTHEMDVIKAICNQVAVMEKGRIIEQQDVYQVFANPTSDLMKHFVENLYDDRLPEELLQKHQHDTIVRLIFLQETAEQPIIDYVKEQFDISISIIHGKIEYINNTPLGHLTIVLSGENTEKQNAIDYLNNSLSAVRVVNYNE